MTSIQEKARQVVNRLLEFNVEKDYATETETKPGVETEREEREKREIRPGTRPFRRGDIKPGEEPRPKAKVPKTEEDIDNMSSEELDAFIEQNYRPAQRF